MIRAVIWDIDGTLINSEPLHLKALLAVCDQHGVDISDLPDERFIGVHLRDVWLALRDRFPPALSMADWIAALSKAYADHASELTEMPDAAAVVKWLAKQGIRQAAVSNSNRAVVDSNLSALGIASFMEFSLSLDDVSAGKPSPEPYLWALVRLGLSADRTIAVEDSRTGVQSAQSAGISVVAFGDAALGGDWHISGLRQIPELIAAG